MKSVALVASVLLLTGCANSGGGGSLFDAINDLDTITRAAVGLPSNYQAPTLAASPTSSGCNTNKCRELDAVEARGYELARAGQIKWIQLVDWFYSRRAELYPETNDQFGASELRAYQRMLAEQMDTGRLTESQWVYLIEKKNSEINTRNQTLSNSAPRTTNCTTTNAGTPAFPRYETSCR